MSNECHTPPLASLPSPVFYYFFFYDGSRIIIAILLYYPVSITFRGCNVLNESSMKSHNQNEP